MSQIAEAEFGGLPDSIKKALVSVFRSFLPNLRFGPMDVPKAENFAGYKLTSTTALSTGEFSIEHGMGRAPYLAIPMVDLSAVGARIVPLTVTRAADSRRAYFKTEAGSTGALFTLYLE